MKSVRLLMLGALLAWALLVVPGWMLWGDIALMHSLVALAICLVPALATLLWVVWSGTSPENVLVAVLGGTGLRLFAALGIGLVLTETLPESFPQVFWIWVGAFYAVVLTVEVVLLVGQSKRESV